jgi:hypothetical protein
VSWKRDWISRGFTVIAPDRPRRAPSWAAPRPEFPPHLESLLDSIAAFAGLPCQTGLVRSYGLRFDVN